MKQFTLLLALLALSFISFSQSEEQNAIDLLSAPENWRKETLSFPISFAPDIKYEGVEEVRFAPGWPKKDAKDFWTFSFVWYIDEAQPLNEKNIAEGLQAYFNGLMSLVGGGKTIDAKVLASTQAKLKKIDANTYEGQVDIFDAFFTEDVMPLQVKIKTDFCGSKQKQYMHAKFTRTTADASIWKTLDQVIFKVPCK